MNDPRLEKWAEILVDYSVRAGKGDTVEVMGGPVAAPLIEAVHRRLLERGSNPVVNLHLPGLDETLLRRGTDEQLGFLPSWDLERISRIDGWITIWCEENTRRLTGVDPKRQARRAEGMVPFKDIYHDRLCSQDRPLRWVGTLYPTQGYAQDAEMSLGEFEDYVFSACRADRDDPAGAWREVSARQQTLVDFMKDKREVRVVGENTDLRFRIQGRTFLNCDGHLNMPDGEICTAPLEDSVNGVVHFSFPCCWAGKEVQGVTLQFQDGRVTRASAAKNERFLLEMLEVDEGACRLGEFAIGTNYEIDRPVKHMLFDEKVGGTVHMALGSTLGEAGGKNRSAIHWDMLCDLRSGGEIYVDGELIHRDGGFLID
jgi:aminopeptidase